MNYVSYCSLFLVLTFVFLASACTDANRTMSVLEKNGFSEIEILGFRSAGCPSNFDFSTEFRAKDKNGDIQTGVVCSGRFPETILKVDAKP
ncbi:MAG: hypothetical protein AAGB12_16710 [Pseudomonadota bacterium]